MGFSASWRISDVGSAVSISARLATTPCQLCPSLLSTKLCEGGHEGVIERVIEGVGSLRGL
eukprot:1192295-Prorocentrum_minimum.AAC.3